MRLHDMGIICSTVWLAAGDGVASIVWASVWLVAGLIGLYAEKRTADY
jgi:hypothetical protein